ncbi:hypothetical protein C4K19_4181 [Pseudomonas chlororaphis subsp. aurantiaca]|nr:hypothetical protein C4K19_4181 [Pseudomonas chlororaphis subsp. aurantiaca]AZD74547.1 hypothetical protein C4K16_4196 [Pseudomonas chlororaphis subsp. aurantiaca]
MVAATALPIAASPRLGSGYRVTIPVAAAEGCDRLRSKRDPGHAVRLSNRVLGLDDGYAAERRLRQRLQR